MATTSSSASQPVTHQTPNDRDGHDGVEVQAAEVGAQPAAAAEPVAVGDVGVEGRPDQVEARRPWRPGVAPPRRAAAAWPNSWKPAESTVTTRTSSSRPGLAKASWVAEASPLTNSTHQHMARKAAVTAHHDQGVNSAANGAVIRRVPSGSVTDVPEPQPSSGFDFLHLGLGAVGQLQQAEGQQLGVDQRRGRSSALTSRPYRVAGVLGDLVEAALAVDRLEHQVQQRVSWMVWPSARRTRDGRFL